MPITHRVLFVGAVNFNSKHKFHLCGGESATGSYPSRAGRLARRHVNIYLVLRSDFSYIFQTPPNEHVLNLNNPRKKTGVEW